MTHADGCELQHDRELGECTCYLAERAERDFLRDRIATLEAALREAREWIPVPPAGLMLTRSRMLQAQTTLEKIDAALAQPVGGK